MNRPNRLLLFFLTGALTLAGCPHRFEPAAAPAIASPVDAANRAFASARGRFEGGDHRRAEDEFRRFTRTYPSDPLAPLARVYLGRVALAGGKPAAARSLLAGPAARGPADAVGLRARYFLGLAEVRAGAAAAGQRRLTPFLATIDRRDRPGLLAALARATASLGQHEKAVALLAELHGVTARPVERLHARTELERIISGPLAAAGLERTYHAADSSSLLAALTGRRLATMKIKAGDRTAGHQILAATAAARATHRVTLRQTAGPIGNVIGLLVPFSGRFKAAGQLLLAGALEGSRSLGPSKNPIALAIRDSSKGAAAAAVELIEDARVLALVGTLDPHNTRQVSQIAAARGIPFVSLARIKAPPGSLPPFVLLPDNATRAVALATFGTRRGLRRLAILRPDSAYGRLMGRAFERAVKDGGGAVAVEVTYPPRATSFSAHVKKLRGHQFSGIFVPDTARRLELLAPALARAGLWPAGQRPPRKRGVKSVRLLATADGLTDRLISVAGRYLDGAVLAPGFYADAASPGSGAHVTRFQQRQGHRPGLLEALGFDAVELLRSHRKAGRTGHDALRRALSGSRGIRGMTGYIRFDAGGLRADPPLLYRVSNRRITQTN